MVSLLDVLLQTIEQTISQKSTSSIMPMGFSIKDKYSAASRLCRQICSNEISQVVAIAIFMSLYRA
jgi:hypothetical protein